MKEMRIKMNNMRDKIQSFSCYIYYKHDMIQRQYKIQNLSYKYL